MEKLNVLKGHKEGSLRSQYRIENISKKDIAIIGMAGRFGAADNCREFWKGLRAGKDFICDIPEGRKQDCEIYAEALAASGLADRDDMEYFKAAFLNRIDRV